MIRSFKCKETKKIWEGFYSGKFSFEIQSRILRKLRQLDAAIVLDDLKVPPGNSLEFLRGNRVGLMSIRVNQKWRICFRWENGEAYDVEIVDYH